MVNFDIGEFMKAAKQEGPPFKCPMENCDKMYRSAMGIQYHLSQSSDHNNTSISSPGCGKTTPGRGRGRGRGRIANTPKMQSAPVDIVKEVISYNDTEKMITFDLDGKLLSLHVDDELEIVDPEEYDALVAAGQCPPFVEAAPEPHIKLPEASVKEVQDYTISDAPPRPNAYIRFIEKTVEELDGEVEYDVDEEDTTWLDIMNEKRSAEGCAPISVEALELLLDRLEKESYFQASTNGHSGAIVDDDAVCCICMDGECQNTNVILFCDMCNLAVHQDCYGVPYIPEGQWLCRRCLQSPSRPVDCVLCPNKGGAFKQTDRNQWAHVVCALWIPEVRFANTVFLEPIDSIEEIPPARWRLCCYICKQKGVGACIQCHRSNCYAAFHVTCAQQAGLHMRMDTVAREGPAGNDGQPVIVQKLAYCDAHTPAQEANDGSDSESERAREESRHKMKQARKMLAKKRTSAPVILIPTIPPERVYEIANLVSASKKQQFIQRLIAYWTLKRHHRNGVPLLRRLQSATHAGASSRANIEGSPDAKELYQQLKYWQSLRQDLERARLLCELVRKREKLKLAYLKAHEQQVMLQINPVLSAMHQLMDVLVQKDTTEIFREPVNGDEVPDYSDIVKYPMDLGTMRIKLEAGMYGSLDDLEADFDLMIRNCLSYNDRDTVYYRAGVRMRDQCATSFKAVRQELEGKGLIEPKKDDEVVGQEIDEEVKKLLQESPSPKVLTSLQVLYERAVARHGICKTKRVRLLKSEMGKLASILERTAAAENEKKSPAKSEAGMKKEPIMAVAMEADEAPVQRTPPTSPIKSSSAPNSASPSGVNRRTAVLFTRKAQAALKKPEVITQLEFAADESVDVVEEKPKVVKKPSGRRPGRPPKIKVEGGPPAAVKGQAKEEKSTAKKSPVKDFLVGSMPESFRVYRSDPKRDVPGSDESDLSNVESGSCSSCSGSSSGSDFECSDDDDDDLDSCDYEPNSDEEENEDEHCNEEHKMKMEQQMPFQPLQLVWAKTRGYPWYPALIMDPDIPNGFNNGVPLPVPPNHVLEMRKNHKEADGPRFLILFFDPKRTWQWLPPTKLEMLGIDKAFDQAKLVESRKPQEKKAVKKAYQDALHYQSQVTEAEQRLLAG